MQNFGPNHLIAAMAIVLIGSGLIFKGYGVPESNLVSAPSVQREVARVTIPAQAVEISEIGKGADDVPLPITRTENELVEINLSTQELVAEMMPGVTYKYWTFDGTVPGPFMRVMEGDDVLIRLFHGDGIVQHDYIQIEQFASVEEASAFMGAHLAYADDGHAHVEEEAHVDDGHAHDEVDTHMDDGHMHTEDTLISHDAEGHATHSIDLHAVLGPGGGSGLTQVGHNGPKAFQFKALRPGIYVYHCASPHIPTHIANGMYGLILVEPRGGLDPVDKEFYIMQGDFYTKGAYGELGHQEFDKEKLLDEKPTYFVFNGRVGSLTGDRALKAKVGDRIRMFVGVGSHVPSNFHLIGGIFDELYSDGAILNEPLKNVQTTIIPAGGAIMVEFTAEVPGTFLLVDHSLTRSIDKGAIAQLVVDGPDQPDKFKGIE